MCRSGVSLMAFLRPVLELVKVLELVRAPVKVRVLVKGLVTVPESGQVLVLLPWRNRLEAFRQLQ